jgi:hypothetical protein
MEYAYVERSLIYLSGLEAQQVEADTLPNLISGPN